MPCFTTAAMPLSACTVCAPLRLPVRLTGLCTCPACCRDVPRSGVCTRAQAAIDQHRSELAGQEVKFAKAIAAEQKGHAEDQAAPENGKTKADIDADLFAAAERKRAIDEAKSAKAGQDYKHVGLLKGPLRSWRVT